MGTHITVEIQDKPTEEKFQKVFDYFRSVDETFSPYKKDSELSKINCGKLTIKDASPQMQEVYELAEKTKQETFGYFDIKKPDQSLDPSGVVKGWAIWKAGLILKQAGSERFFIDVGGDIQASSPTKETEHWKVGIRNPFNKSEIIKALKISNEGVATSGTYERGQHIYNPFLPSQKIEDVVSLTVIGKNVNEADRFATAAFAMGKKGIEFIEKVPGLEGYMVGKDGIATYTSGFNQYV